MNEAMLACRDGLRGEDGNLVNYDDLQCFLDSYPGVNETLGIEDNTNDAWIDAFGSDIDTHQAYLLTATCMSAVRVVATGFAAVAATAIAL